MLLEVKCESRSLFLFDNIKKWQEYTEEELVDHMVVLCLIEKETWTHT